MSANPPPSAHHRGFELERLTLWMATPSGCFEHHGDCPGEAFPHVSTACGGRCWLTFDAWATTLGRSVAKPVPPSCLSTGEVNATEMLRQSHDIVGRPHWWHGPEQPGFPEMGGWVWCWKCDWTDEPAPQHSSAQDPSRPSLCFHLHLPSIPSRRLTISCFAFPTTVS